MVLYNLTHGMPHPGHREETAATCALDAFETGLQKFHLLLSSGPIKRRIMALPGRGIYRGRVNEIEGRASEQPCPRILIGAKSLTAQAQANRGDNLRAQPQKE